MLIGNFKDSELVIYNLGTDPTDSLGPTRTRETASKRKQLLGRSLIPQMESPNLNYDPNDTWRRHRGRIFSAILRCKSKKSIATKARDPS